MGTLEGKGALVTGGSRGIGRAIVKRLAGDGASVVFSYLSRQDAAQSVVDEQYAGRIMRDGGRIISISTLNTRLHPPGGALYTGAKGALEHVTVVAALEFGGRR
jgi:NAD(P)-dependent dehydrogenase (short-subunit alcohol dehydrogenase family)